METNNSISTTAIILLASLIICNSGRNAMILSTSLFTNIEQILSSSDPALLRDQLNLLKISLSNPKFNWNVIPNQKGSTVVFLFSQDHWGLCIVDSNLNYYDSKNYFGSDIKLALWKTFHIILPQKFFTHKMNFIEHTTQTQQNNRVDCGLYVLAYLFLQLNEQNSKFLNDKIMKIFRLNVIQWLKWIKVNIPHQPSTTLPIVID